MRFSSAAEEEAKREAGTGNLIFLNGKKYIRESTYFIKALLIFC